MGILNIDSVNLGPNIVTPVSGNAYNLNNLAFSHWLDNSQGLDADGNPVLAWTLDNPPEQHQEWKYLTYPNDAGITAFTLQAISTVADDNRSFKGLGGYMRVDASTNKLVQGGVPMGWILTEIAPQLYTMMPFEDVFSQGGKLIATDVNSTISSPQNNQVALQVNEIGLNQLWTFNTPSLIELTT